MEYRSNGAVKNSITPILRRNKKNTVLFHYDFFAIDDVDALLRGGETLTLKVVDKGGSREGFTINIGNGGVVIIVSHKTDVADKGLVET